MTGKLLAPALFITAVLFALAARGCSPGGQMTSTVESYLECLSAGEPDRAYTMLTDSLGQLVSPDFMERLRGEPGDGSLELEHWETRGFTVYLRLETGENRTLWLSEEQGRWKVSGDTSLDNILGRASSICRDYAETAVLPLVRSGTDISQSCPVTGLPYLLDPENRILCPAGHLGEGLDTEGGRCVLRRDSVTVIVGDYLSEGFELPASFQEMYQSGGGAWGQPGGYRCPDQGYSYYRIESGSVYCPWHEEYTQIPLPEVP